MNVLLIHPNIFAHRYVSVGIASISASLKAKGHMVSFLDTSRYRHTATNNIWENQNRTMEQTLQFKPVDLPPITKSPQDLWEALGERIRSFAPDVIGITINSSEYLFAKEIIGQIKAISRIPIVLGGPHVTVCAKNVLQDLENVTIIVGEGERAFCDFIAGAPAYGTPNMGSNSGPFIDLNAPQPYVRPLDTLPMPDLSIFDQYHHLGAYQGQQAVYARIETSRGCPFACHYCINKALHDLYSNESSHVRMKSAERTLEELLHTQKEIGFDVVRFIDENFLVHSTAWLEYFSYQYKKNINLPFIIATRPETISRKKLKILRCATNDIQITMGIESGDEWIRESICNRHISNSAIIEAYHWCHEMGFNTAAFNMIGLPFEDRTRFMRTVDLNHKTQTNMPILSYFYPFPGTKLRDVCLEEGFIEDKFHQADYSVGTFLNMPNFSPQEINGLKRTFVLYVTMPRSMWPEIQKAEQDDEVFKKMVTKHKTLLKEIHV